MLMVYSVVSPISVGESWLNSTDLNFRSLFWRGVVIVLAGAKGGAREHKVLDAQGGVGHPLTSTQCQGIDWRWCWSAVLTVSTNVPWGYWKPLIWLIRSSKSTPGENPQEKNVDMNSVGNYFCSKYHMVIIFLTYLGGVDCESST